MTHNLYLYLVIMALVSFSIRVIPLTILQTQIKNRFIRSFLYYVPYVTLAVMTFPAIITVTQNPSSGVAALIVGAAAAWLGAGLFPVATLCCFMVYLLEIFM